MIVYPVDLTEVYRCMDIYSEIYPERQRVDHIVLGNNFFIATDDKDLGFVGYTLRDSHIYINNLCVLPDFRDRGIGSRLVNAVLDVAFMEDFSKVTALTHRTALLSRLGFIPEELRHREDH